ncbi:hypothetical protein EXIGLDRAFT_140133 [Exidia glandulosa HHB12029]|uniref:Uncharacterized protein n=1 Tax=Exidia glandulosa HHB12029 TaxID=1314781 RepID=A0A165FX49_EXIGL|nr:hypothetical protein EXIGLDRAFT_140133 [Exidia glandulosa HHB12029]
MRLSSVSSTVPPKDCVRSQRDRVYPERRRDAFQRSPHPVIAHALCHDGALDLEDGEGWHRRLSRCSIDRAQNTLRATAHSILRARGIRGDMICDLLEVRGYFTRLGEEQTRVVNLQPLQSGSTGMCSNITRRSSAQRRRYCKSDSRSSTSCQPPPSSVLHSFRSLSAPPRPPIYTLLPFIMIFLHTLATCNGCVVRVIPADCCMRPHPNILSPSHP